MKTGSMKLIATLVCFGWSLATQAIPINGAISFGGTSTLANDSADPVTLANATRFTAINARVQFGATGDYSSIAFNTPSTWTPFRFASPPATSITPLWEIVVGTVTYSFNATSMSYTPYASYLDFQGAGVARITDSSNTLQFDDTVGSWTMTVTSGGVLFTFNDTTTVASVPDGGTTLALLGAALSGLALFRRKMG
jgi:hypothetical protein